MSVRTLQVARYCASTRVVSLTFERGITRGYGPQTCSGCALTSGIRVSDGQIIVHSDHKRSIICRSGPPKSPGNAHPLELEHSFESGITWGMGHRLAEYGRQRVRFSCRRKKSLIRIMKDPEFVPPNPARRVVATVFRSCGTRSRAESHGVWAAD